MENQRNALSDFCPKVELRQSNTWVTVFDHAIAQAISRQLLTANIQV
jgi:hypothetical protein